MDYYRETCVEKFVMVGAAAVLAIGSGLWGMHALAHHGLEAVLLEAPWVVEARTQRKPAANQRAFSTPVASKEIHQAVERWRRENRS
jgi:hypothetical protein